MIDVLHLYNSEKVDSTRNEKMQLQTTLLYNNSVFLSSIPLQYVVCCKTDTGKCISQLFWLFIICLLKVKMMMLKVIARTIGLHRLVVLNFYPYFMNYITVCYLIYSMNNFFFVDTWIVTLLASQPHQNGVTELLASAVQACHDMVT